tara:strand:+ start:45 stop:275 length:231 start_codon:yes stop_codon:yes gene_type:complete
MVAENIIENRVQTIGNINNYQGGIPAGYDLVEYQKFTDPTKGFVLHGFDEIGMCIDPSNASYAFVWIGEFYSANRK